MYLENYAIQDISVYGFFKELPKRYKNPSGFFCTCLKTICIIQCTDIFRSFIQKSSVLNLESIFFVSENSGRQRVESVSISSHLQKFTPPFVATTSSAANASKHPRLVDSRGTLARVESLIYLTRRSRNACVFHLSEQIYRVSQMYFSNRDPSYSHMNLTLKAFK